MAKKSVIDSGRKGLQNRISELAYTAKAESERGSTAKKHPLTKSYS